MKKDLISIEDLDRARIERYLELSARLEQMPPREKLGLLRGRILATMFYEPSTRTRLSFEAAMCRLGGSTIGFSEAGSTSVAKGESLRDSVRTVAQFADAIVLRHPREGAARISAESVKVPVINAGDGANQHPSQTLLDLYTIQKTFGRLSGFRIALVGDLKYSRTIHSLVQALALFEDIELLLVSPPSLRLPAYLSEASAASRVRFRETEELRQAVCESDVIYMTRIQKERFPDLVEYEKVKDAYRLEAASLAEARPHLKVLHPLPRLNEIAPDVDETPYASYFEQAANGVIMRQAILLDLLEVKA